MKVINRRYVALARLAAGFLEKLSVASMAVGLFQSQAVGFFVAFGALAGAVAITYILEQ